MRSLSTASGSLASGVGKIHCSFCQFQQNVFESNLLHPDGQQISDQEKKKKSVFL